MMTSPAAEYFRSLSPLKADPKFARSGRYERSSASKTGRCHCCPYGYHIDLDFVRFCQDLTKGSQSASPTLIQLKKLKKQRRRQTKSVEAMLGITDEGTPTSKCKAERINGLYKKPEYPLHGHKKSTPPSPPPRKQSLTHPALQSPPPPDIINSSSFYSSVRSEKATEALQEAVLDFEETFQSSKEQRKRKSKLDQGLFYPSVDLLHHTPYHYPYPKRDQKASMGRSNSLPRQFGQEIPYYSQLKDWSGFVPSHPCATNGYVSSYQPPLIAEALATLNAAHGVSSNQALDMETMSITSGMSGVSTTTLQSIRDQMATGLARLKELEEEVRSIPSLQVKLDILKEEKKLLLEQVRCLQRGEEPPIVPPSIEKDFDDMTKEDLEGKLFSIRKYGCEKGRKRSQRNRSISPLKVNLEDFHSYRRSRRGSLSEGSDTESLTGPLKEETRLFIYENGEDVAGRTSIRSSGKRGTRDAAVSCRVVTRDVGVSQMSPWFRSIGTVTDGPGESSVREVKSKPCLTCLRRSQKEFEEPVQEIVETASAKSALLEKLGKKSPIISRLSSPQLHPPPLTFDNSTSTEPIFLRDQRLNTVLQMQDLFTREELAESIQEAKKQWEATYARKLSPEKVLKVPSTVDRSIQTYLDDVKRKPYTKNIGIMAKQTMRDISVGDFDSRPAIKTRSVGCGSTYSSALDEEEGIIRKRSVGIGEARLDDTICAECINKQRKRFRSIGSGNDRVTDNICSKCSNIHRRHIGVGSSRITDEICKSCKLKRMVNVSCQALPSMKSIAVEAILTPTTTVKESKTSEIDRRPFGSSGVRICDKCHAAITSVAKDIIGTSGSPLPSVLPPQNLSKIPRIVDGQKAEAQPPLSSWPRNHELATNSERPYQEVSDKQSLSILSQKDESFPSSSSFSGSHPATRFPYERQGTYTKLTGSEGGYVNPTFEEFNPKRELESVPTKAPKKTSGDKPLKAEKSKSTIKEGSKDTQTSEEAKSLSSSSSSSSYSDDGDAEDDGASVMASSVATTVETQITDQGKGQSRKKSLPNREMKAALKVLNDSIGRPFRSSQQLTNAINIIQKDWFKVSSQMDADPHVVEDYMDSFEEYSKGLLQRVVNLSDNNGNTAMHYAVSHGNFDIVSVLLDSKVCSINQQNKAGYTAIMLVALAQIKNSAHKSVVSKLFEIGDVNIRASQHGQTALMLAVSHGRLDMVRLLISSGADPNIQDEDGSSALMCAAEHGHLAIVRYLITQPDTDMYLTDNDGSTALTIAVEAGHKDVGVVLYKKMHLSRGSSPYGSMRGAKRSQTPTFARAAITPPPRSSAPPSPGRSRKSSGRASPAARKPSSASLSNLNF